MLGRFHRPPTSPDPLQRRTPPSLFAITPQITDVCFQQVTHSSQNTKRSNSFGLFALRTLCQKHPGVGYPKLRVKFRHIPQSPITPTESCCSPNVPSKPFRILLFQNMYPLNPLPSICFANVGRRSRLHTRKIRQYNHAESCGRIGAVPGGVCART